MTTDPGQDRGAFASEPGSREPSQQVVSALTGFDPSRGNLAGALEAAADLAAAGDRLEQLRAKLDCEAFAMRERMAARSAEYFAKKDRERAR